MIRTLSPRHSLTCVTFYLALLVKGWGISGLVPLPNRSRRRSSSFAKQCIWKINWSHCHNQTVYSPLDLIEASIATEQPEKLFEPLKSFYFSIVHSKSKPSVKKYIICEKKQRFTSWTRYSPQDLIEALQLRSNNKKKTLFSLWKVFFGSIFHSKSKQEASLRGVGAWISVWISDIASLTCYVFLAPRLGSL